MKQSYINEIKNYSFITAGSIILAIGIVVFFIPVQIATGGTPGIAIILHYITGMPTGMLMTAVNIPLLIAGFRMLGKGFAVRTVITIVLSSILIDLFSEVVKLPQITESTMLATLYGGDMCRCRGRVDSERERLSRRFDNSSEAHSRTHRDKAGANHHVYRPDNYHIIRFHI